MWDTSDLARENDCRGGRTDGMSTGCLHLGRPLPPSLVSPPLRLRSPLHPRDHERVDTRTERHVRPLVIATLDRRLPAQAALKSRGRCNAGCRPPHTSRAACGGTRSVARCGMTGRAARAASAVGPDASVAAVYAVAGVVRAVRGEGSGGCRGGWQQRVHGGYRASGGGLQGCPLRGPAGRPPAPLAVRLSCSNGSPIAAPLAGL